MPGLPPTRRTSRVARGTAALLAAGALSATSTLPAGAAPGVTGGSTASASTTSTSTSVTVGAAAPVTFTTDGRAATVPLTIRTPDGAPLARDVVVGYATRGGDAAAGRDYRPAAGSVTFPAGSASGSTRAVQVATMRTPASVARTVEIALSPPSGVSVAAPPRVVIDAHGLPYQNPRLPVRTRVADLLSRMTLAEKVGQMTQAERGSIALDPTQIKTYALGSLLSGGGSVPTPNTPTAWADMVDGFQSQALTTRLQIPLLYGIDSVHGDGNMFGATVFPHNIGLGATRDPALVKQVEHVTAIETRATGPQWTFAPCVCAARDDRWGRTYESFSEDPGLVTAMETAIDGFQGRPGGRDLADPDRVLATAKHYAGDGDTVYGTSTTGDYKIDQGVDVTSYRDFWTNALRQYLPAVRQHDVGTVMPSYSSVDWTEDGVGDPIKMHANKQLITGVLKGAMGFRGFVITDYNAIDQLPGNFATQVRTAVDAGNDMFMEPSRYAEFESTLISEVNAGRVPMSRIDDAVSRILTKKFQMGLFEHPFTDRRNLDTVGLAAHRAVARRAVAESQVLLKNTGHALPIRPGTDVYVAGSNADNLGNQAGGWTLQWQGVVGQHEIPGTTILDGIRAADRGGTVTYSADASAPVGNATVGIVVVGETPYAEGYGDVGAPGWPYGAPEQKLPKTMTPSDSDKTAIDRVCSRVVTCVVSVVSGRPLIIDPAQLGEIDALVASWLPGSEGEGVADVLFGARPFTGRLPMTWPRALAQEPINVGDASYDPLYPFGWGLSTGPGNPWRTRAEAAFQAASGDPAARQRIAKLIAAADQARTAGRAWQEAWLYRQAAGSPTKVGRR